MLYIYDIFLRFSAFILGVVGVFNKKLGRRNGQLKRQTIPDLRECIWVHAASLGEFEQGKTVIDSLKETFEGTPVVLTFFSSSGYDKRKDYEGVDYVCYMPYDTRKEMAGFVNRINPVAVVFIKYEFWFNTLRILKENGIPYYFISSVFREDQFFMKGIFSSFFSLIAAAKWLFVQDRSSGEILESRGVRNVSISGDSRVDRVIEVARGEYENRVIEDFVKDSFTVIVGSSWPPDEELIAEAVTVFPDWKWVIAPHEINRSHIDSLLDKTGREKTVLFSEASPEMPGSGKVLIIDRIGILSRIYRYGDVAYIGGGFGAGIHNTLEPVVYGLPVIFGPRYGKFQEAVHFVKKGIGKSVEDSGQLIGALRYFSNENTRDLAKNKIEIYLKENSGATKTIVEKIKSDLAYSNDKKQD